MYPNKGHSFHTPAHQKDVLPRNVAWFNKNLK
jgi:dipeptidyl aminopeptidase/acylaminoacyl peptidase